MKIRISFNDSDLTATLEDNPTARDFASLLPLQGLKIENYGNNEKISYLPRKLTEEGSGPFGNERPGDLGYFAPWGNLAMYHGDYRWSRGLIRLGPVRGKLRPSPCAGRFSAAHRPCFLIAPKKGSHHAGNHSSQTRRHPLRGSR